MGTIKILASTVTLGLLVSSSLLAQDDAAKTQNKQQDHQKVKIQMPMHNEDASMGNFMDEDGNGICDRLESGQRMRQNSDGQMGHGRNFIDEDGDGVCDNRGSGKMQKGRGHGNGQRGNGSMNQGLNH